MSRARRLRLQSPTHLLCRSLLPRPRPPLLPQLLPRWLSQHQNPPLFLVPCQSLPKSSKNPQFLRRRFLSSRRMECTSPPKSPRQHPLPSPRHNQRRSRSPRPHRHLPLLCRPIRPSLRPLLRPHSSLPLNHLQLTCPRPRLLPQRRHQPGHLRRRHGQISLLLDGISGAPLLLRTFVA